MIMKNPDFSTKNWRSITPIQKAEFQQRDFLGNETWVKWKQELDLCMSFRKTIKGKPTDEQMNRCI
jgi:hypothetical protein